MNKYVFLAIVFLLSLINFNILLGSIEGMDTNSLVTPQDGTPPQNETTEMENPPVESQGSSLFTSSPETCCDENNIRKSTLSPAAIAECDDKGPFCPAGGQPDD